MRTVVGDIGEFARFVVTGGVATLCNMAVVWMSRGSLPVGASFICGLFAGMCASFLLMKTFAFRSNDWSGAKGELFRFVIVYLAGTVLYLIAAVVTEHLLSAAAIPPRLAAIGGVFVGGALMALSSYVGHRHFTYRTPRSGESG